MQSKSYIKYRQNKMLRSIGTSPNLPWKFAYFIAAAKIAYEQNCSNVVCGALGCMAGRTLLVRRSKSGFCDQLYRSLPTRRNTLSKKR